MTRFKGWLRWRVHCLIWRPSDRIIADSVYCLWYCQYMQEHLKEDET